MRPPATYAFRVGLDRAGKDRRFAFRSGKTPRAPWADALPSMREGRAAWPAQRAASSPSARRPAIDDEGPS